MKRLCSFLLTWSLLPQLYAQLPLYTTVSYEVVPNKEYVWHLGGAVTSLSVEFAPGTDISGCRLMLNNGTTIALQADSHQERYASQLTVFDSPQESIRFQSGKVRGKVTLHLLSVPRLPDSRKWWEYEPVPFREENVCEKPTVVPAAQWRAGLPPPRNPPEATQVRFIIIHHEAGSNNPRDFTETVRNIYIFHTQSNGWNDIGYNFVIAQNGVIFEGRDGQGRMDGDNVLGAHFCGKNSNTMGICLLGNYMTAEPPQAALLSLHRLIAWKMEKENLPNPFGRAVHLPGTSLQSTLNIISGHRDGCSTDCPGENVYRRLEEIRRGVQNACNVLAATSGEQQRKEIAVYPSPASDRVRIEYPLGQVGEVVITTVDGRQVAHFQVGARSSVIEWQTTGLSRGLYICRFTDANGDVLSKKIVLE
ncbi:MAG: N-acetylmuramoyl-L-alanine amidase [Cytophagales bacterium]|nr:N-acetylmuramoyl-L-alanine amidase [Bernardetiaceae bacterium]MDW8204640.1 N-acetylmuramoyl-L-alanine amidase [Cytophagales bacterium]